MRVCVCVCVNVPHDLPQTRTTKIPQTGSFSLYFCHSLMNLLQQSHPSFSFTFFHNISFYFLFMTSCKIPFLLCSQHSLSHTHTLTHNNSFNGKDWHTQKQWPSNTHILIRNLERRTTQNPEKKQAFLFQSWVSSFLLIACLPCFTSVLLLNEFVCFKTTDDTMTTRLSDDSGGADKAAEAPWEKFKFHKRDIIHF